jgi:hypothetical protein
MRATKDSFAFQFIETIGDCDIEGAIDLDHVCEERRVVRGFSVSRVGSFEASAPRLPFGRSSGSTSHGSAPNARSST